MMNMEWQVFCKDTLTGDVVASCLGTAKDPTYLNWIFKAWGWTVGVSLTALVVALVVGSIIGVIRTLPDSPWLTRFGNAWVELFRNIPLLVQIFLWYFVASADSAAQEPAALRAGGAGAGLLHLGAYR